MLLSIARVPSENSGQNVPLAASRSQIVMANIGAVIGRPAAPSRSGSSAKFAAILSDLPDRITSVFLLLLLFGKQIDYQLSV